MPFSMAVRKNCLNSVNFVSYIHNLFYSKKNVTLQVRIPNNREIEIQPTDCCHGKKVFLTASKEKNGKGRTALGASLTLEATLVLSLFVFAVVCLILPMKIMNTDRKIQAALESVGEDFSRYAYLKDVLDKGEASQVPGAGEFAKAFCGHLVSGAAVGYAQVSVSGHIDTVMVKNVRMLRSSILEDGEMFDLILDYEVRMPFPVLGLSGIQRTARCRRRAWIGKAGIYGTQGEGSGDSRDEIVYVGKNSTRYHRNRSCHYLANNLSSVSYEELANMRNDGGGRYRACRICGSDAGTGGTVYIMPSGDSYHTTRSCRAIAAYVRAVRLSEVEHLGSCSYCSR